MPTKQLCVLIHIRKNGRLVPLNMFKPSSIFTDRSKVVLFLLFMFHVCLCYGALSVPCSLVITCWERAGFLGLLCFLVFLSLSHIVSQIKCSYCLYFGDLDPFQC